MAAKKHAKHLKQAEPAPVQAKKPINYGLYFIILFILLVISLLLIFWDRLTVREIEVEGVNKVNYLEVIHLSGIEYMSNIFTIDLDDVKIKIEQNPLLKVTDIKRKLPDTIVITLEEREPVAAILFEGKYITINKNCIALEVFDQSGQPGLPIINGTNVVSYELGETLELEKNIHSKKLIELLTAFDEIEIEDLIETIDISFTENITLMSKAGYEIQIGSTENIENKCAWIQTMIQTLVEEGKEGGVIYVTNVDSAHYIGPDSE